MTARPPAHVLVRSLIVLTCSLGLVGMHQLVAAPARASQLAATVMEAAAVADDDCGDSACATCHDHTDVCAALPALTWSLDVADATLVAVLPAHTSVTWVRVGSSASPDPPDLTRLSMSRT